MNVVFADTVALLALWNRSDQWHQVAKGCFQQLLQANSVIVTTTCVLLECGNAAARTPFRHEVCRLRESLSADGILIEPTSVDWDLAWQDYENGVANLAGIVDQISFQVMRRLGLSQAFTNDGHFRAAGFVTLF